MFKLSTVYQRLPTSWKPSSPAHGQRRGTLLFLFCLAALATFLLFFITSSGYIANRKLATRTWRNLSNVDLNSLILIDPEVLSCLGCQLPDRPIEFITFFNKSSRSHLAIIHRAHGNLQKDFFTVEYDDETRAVAKFKLAEFEVDGFHFLVPEDVERFLWSWRRSKFINCLGLDMGQKEKKDFKEVASGVARFRALAEAHDVTLTLNGGSLLGWYRECSIIPNTTDLDFTINSEEHSPNFMRAMETSKDFKLHHTYAEPTKCFQFKASLMETKTKLDVFYFYRNASMAWTCGSLDKFRVYPPTMEFCTGELLGTLVYVPCAVEEHLEVNYGKTGSLDVVRRWIRRYIKRRM